MKAEKPEALRLAELLEKHMPDQVEKASAAELRRLHQHEIANNEWWGKTDWVQETCESHELGMHRADVLKQRIDRLLKQVENFDFILDQAFKDQKDAERYMHLKWILTDPTVKKKFDGATPEDIDVLLDQLIRSYDE